MGGAWIIAESARLDRELNALNAEGAKEKFEIIDASKINRLESAGAWLLLRTRRACPLDYCTCENVSQKSSE